jgi:lantibiotic modifying enzyme
MGDLHPNYSTKVLSKTSVIYGKYPEYFDLLDRITKLFWKNNEDFFPSIKGLEEFSIRNFIDINKETESEEIIKDFYFNLGSLISFLFSIRAVDINAENMIVNLPNPVFYDMETIFSGSFEEDYDVYGALNTGFVKINEKRDMSLLTGGIGERESLLKPIITGTDKQPQIRWRTLSKGKYNNIPILNGSYVKAGDYINSLRRGGFDSFGKINKQKEEIKDIVKNTRTITRVVLRPTRIYRHLMLQTVYPQVFLNEDIETYLRNKLEDLRVIYDIEDPESIINYEIAALKIFQIPTFYSDIQSKDILSANGDVVARWGISQYEIWEKYFFESFNKDFIENQFQIIEDLIE